MNESTHPPLPMRNGVKASYLFLPHDARYSTRTLLEFLCAHFSFITEQAWRARLNSGFVLAQDGTVLNEDAPYRAGEKIYYYREISRADEPRIPFDEQILHVDEHLIVVDKPHFLPVIPSGRFLQETLLTRLRLRPELQHLNLADITPIHRLDKDTAGVMLFSHNRATRGAYQSLFQFKQVNKVYEAIAPTRTDLIYPLEMASRLQRHAEHFYLTEQVTGEPNAFTTIELIENRGAHSLYRLRPTTGKKHQLRVHMMGLGMPLLNDGLYPVPTSMDGVDYAKPLKLLARSIAFADPMTGQLREFFSGFNL
ncbi:MAG: pseudouridine synthase [Burkholderiaceae bacterium]|nr:pseudouridine synthase [Burkholderiaceae bacterium]